MQDLWERNIGKDASDNAGCGIYTTEVGEKGSGGGLQSFKAWGLGLGTCEIFGDLEIHVDISLSALCRSSVVGKTVIISTFVTDLRTLKI